MSRFRSQEFNEKQIDVSKQFTLICEELDRLMQLGIADSREKSIAMTKLEEFLMWVGKALKEER